MEDQNEIMGEFVYFGIEAGLRNCVSSDIHRENLIKFQINVNGFQPFTSSSVDLWTILGKIHFIPDVYKVFPIAIFCGTTKPGNPDTFLNNFIEELNQLQTNGITISEKYFLVRLKCVICNTPARVFLKQTVGHIGFYACEKCTIKGQSVDHTTVYPSCEAEERTDASFRSNAQPEHHHGPSPFLRIFSYINMSFKEKPDL
ncbi:uncharacterized protein LOC117178642 [Belonocnema kinseyi]|uniref:uncharacterized protein LOC117178642 n=1 Tax=Belonocnema kinseyi TaxID=2817044 RepID=UPI00143CF863|nr:uncharacterized protein LOC117178642 [Belonocnema kinseyi]